MLQLGEQLRPYPVGYPLPGPPPNYYNLYPYYGNPGVNPHPGSFHNHFPPPSYSHFYFNQGCPSSPPPEYRPPLPPSLPLLQTPPAPPPSCRPPVQIPRPSTIQRPPTAPPPPNRTAANMELKTPLQEPQSISPFNMDNKLDMYLLGKFPVNKKCDSTSVHQVKENNNKTNNKERCQWNRQLQNDFVSSRMALRSYMRSHQLFFRTPYRGLCNYDIKSGKHFYQTVS